MLYPNKPGVMPGKPLALFAEFPVATSNRYRHIAAQDARRAGLEIRCSGLNKLESKLVIGVCNTPSHAAVEQRGRRVVLHLGGAF